MTLEQLQKRFERLEEAYGHALAELADRADVVDGDYGEPEANFEMRLAMQLEEMVEGPSW